MSMRTIGEDAGLLTAYGKMDKAAEKSCLKRSVETVGTPGYSDE